MANFPRVSRGYHPDQVDAFVARIEGTLGRSPLYAQPVTAQEVAGVRFSVVWRGYAMKPVDDALDKYLKELEAHAGPRRIRSADTDRLIGLVRNVMFATTRMQVGYDEGQVDQFLDQTIVALRENKARPSEVRAAQFSTTRMRPGYRQPEVDAFLDRLASEIERLRRPS